MVFENRSFRSAVLTLSGKMKIFFILVKAGFKSALTRYSFKAYVLVLA